jgi:hypothetical protein
MPVASWDGQADRLRCCESFTLEAPVQRWQDEPLIAMVGPRRRRLFKASSLQHLGHMGLLPFVAAQQAVMCQALTPPDRSVVCQTQLAGKQPVAQL